MEWATNSKGGLGQGEKALDFVANKLISMHRNCTNLRTKNRKKRRGQNGQNNLAKAENAEDSM
jgi:hypothetical protein